jgi:phage terminase large subunit-like protein
MNSAPGVPLGSVTPRLWTPPLRDLTPATSYGFDVIDFAAEVLETPLDPWQEWTVIHAGELLPDGRPRFRVVLILVARQNGKTLLAKVLALFWLFVERVPLVLGTSTNREYAKAVWRELCEQAQTNPHLAAELGPKPVRATIGEEELITAGGCRYKIAASNRRAGRSLTVHRLILDELREHQSFEAWDAATNAMNAVPHGQVVAISNQGDDTAVVLDSLREPALRYIETGDGDPRLGLIEYSSPPGSDPTDLAAVAQANPNLGHRIDPDALLGAALRAKAAGGEELAGFRTEVMCQRVHLLDPAIDPDRWDDGGTDDPVDLAEHRDRVALCVDVALDGSHATLVAAAALDGKVHSEVVRAWDGYGCTQQLRAELPDLVAKIRPRALGWFPAGPAAAVAADLKDRGARGWPPRRVAVDEIRSEAAAVCMGLAELVKSGELVHPNDDMLTMHVKAAQRLWRGDAWVFGRKGATPIDGAYALAGAVHLARTLPPAPPPLTVL